MRKVSRGGVAAGRAEGKSLCARLAPSSGAQGSNGIQRRKRRPRMDKQEREFRLRGPGNRVEEGGRLMRFAGILKMTRDELYEKVWSTPMVTIAKELGISDRGLAKVCDRLEVPVPPRGRWAKLQADKPSSKIPLPSPKPMTPQEITLRKAVALRRAPRNPE